MILISNSSKNCYYSECNPNFILGGIYHEKGTHRDWFIAWNRMH